MKTHLIPRTWEDRLRQAQRDRARVERRRDEAKAGMPQMPAPMVRVRFRCPH
jgi:hypothetical protein